MLRLPLTDLWILILAMAAPLAQAAPAPTLLVLGDSLSAAYGIAVEEGWVNLLQVRLREKGLDHRVVNASLSGETTAGGLTRLPALLAEYSPAVVVIALGANDGLRGFPFDILRDNLTRMIHLARASGARVLVAGVRLPPNYGAGYNQGFQAVFPAVAEAQRVPLAPQILAGVDDDPDLMQADGLHPGTAAQPLILANLWAQLEPLLMEP